MIVDAEVEDVFDLHDCIGRKYISVTTKAEDEAFKIRYELYRGYLYNLDKLALATVSPLDKIKIFIDYTDRNILGGGQYIEISTDTSARLASCECRTPLISDGFDIYCPNQNCHKTAAARLRRIAAMRLYHHEAFYHEFSTDSFHIVQDDQMHYSPFMMIAQGSFWGQPSSPLESILGSPRVGAIGVADFLVRSMFEELVDRYTPPGIFNSYQWNQVNQFYIDLESFTRDRTYGDPRQELLISAFLHALGLQSLTTTCIGRLVQHEQLTQLSADPFLHYIYMLTHPDDLVHDIGLHPLEAATIVGEVQRRQHELYDIFSHYVVNHDDLRLCFRKLYPHG